MLLAHEFDNFTFIVIFLQVVFEQGNADRACCVSGGQYHKRCHCEHVTEKKDCESLCLHDTGCKGYVQLDGDNLGNICQLATTSKCPDNCRGPTDISHIQSLEANGTCGKEGQWNGGCLIKTG